MSLPNFVTPKSNEKSWSKSKTSWMVMPLSHSSQRIPTNLKSLTVFKEATLTPKMCSFYFKETPSSRHHSSSWMSLNFLRNNVSRQTNPSYSEIRLIFISKNKSRTWLWTTPEFLFSLSSTNKNKLWSRIARFISIPSSRAKSNIWSASIKSTKSATFPWSSIARKATQSKS